jgi:hypothetical protein
MIAAILVGLLIFTLGVAFEHWRSGRGLNLFALWVLLALLSIAGYALLGYVEGFQ